MTTKHTVTTTLLALALLTGPGCASRPADSGPVSEAPDRVSEAAEAAAHGDTHYDKGPLGGGFLPEWVDLARGRRRGWC
jgi:hypothetical protein